MGPPPAVAAVRHRVREALERYSPDASPLVVACSGGADSVALAAAAAFVARGAGRRAALVTVDHGLQPGSAERAAAVVGLGRQLGFDQTEAVVVSVGQAGGPEAAARSARYAALAAAADRFGGPEPARVLLGHTLDDQAETVLLGLGRGSGLASLAGMRPAQDRYLRPLLGLRRTDTRRACIELGLPVWDDPHNDDPRFRRSRVRRELLPLMEEVLGGGVAEALARTAAQLRDADDALSVEAERVARLALEPTGPTEPTGPIGPAGERTGLAIERPGLAVEPVRAAPAAVRARVLKSWAEASGAAALTAAHVRALDALITGWRGQGPIDLPGGLRVLRASGTLRIVPPARISGPTGQE